MPSLKVPWVAAMNSCSLMSSRRWNVTSVGMVASPTPTVPISSDSMSLMSSTRPSVFASPAATIHPAVPPPAMTILRITFGSKVVLQAARASAIELLQYARAQLTRARFIERSQHAACRGGNVRGRLRVRCEDVMTEQVLPGRALLGRQIAHGHHREHQRIHGRIHEARRAAPPVVDEHVEGIERLDVVPPHARDEHRI